MRTGELIRVPTTLLLLLAATGCAAALANIRYGALDVQSELDRSIFLTPSASTEAVFLDVRNTAGVETPVREVIRGALSEAGHQVVDDPEVATLVVQVNVMQITKQALDEDQEVMDAIVQAAAAGATLGAVVGVLGAEEAVDEVLVLGGVAAFALDAITRPIVFTILADVRIIEVHEGDVETVHDVRVIGAATKVRLEYEEAAPRLAQEVARVVSAVLTPAH